MYQTAPENVSQSRSTSKWKDVAILTVYEDCIAVVPNPGPEAPHVLHVSLIIQVIRSLVETPRPEIGVREMMLNVQC